jgi:hypothetical protein
MLLACLCCNDFSLFVTGSASSTKVHADFASAYDLIQLLFYFAWWPSSSPGPNSSVLHGTENILCNVWVLEHFWPPVVRVTPLKTPFGLALLLFQFQSHVTTITHNYFLRCATFTRLTIIHVRNYNHYSTLTRLHWLTSQLPITISNYHTLCIFTLPVSVSYRDITRKTAP